ncbi:alpha-ribazole phosphatase [Pseudoduganella ginsengisoli]|uniref:Phosphoglycerate mutase n=1 Tax=Pseudoduganella ginsengisoli TaxID=1462440 RepID=A0A6L6Q9Y4_9BURK|nr:histidine phosphatase family protein [Pseudoduganella ginsengisoli]MTW06236.1 phosphoglycerate mutase [Pseudoduganella ginsengisoli]
MRLILIRHPQPQAQPGMCYGSTDLPAMPGEAERALAALHSSAILPEAAPLYSSPLQRCAALASLLGRPIFDARLRELHFGSWEMHHWDTIPRHDIDAWAADMAHYRPGGGESATEAAQRVLAFRTELLQQPHGDAIIVCHAGTIRLLSAYEPGISAQETALRAARAAHRIGYGEAVIVEAVR